MPFHERLCADDMALHHRRRRTELNGAVTTRALQADARNLLRTRWRRLVLLAPVLARRGSLAPSRL